MPPLFIFIELLLYCTKPFTFWNLLNVINNKGKKWRKNTSYCHFSVAAIQNCVQLLNLVWIKPPFSVILGQNSEKEYEVGLLQKTKGSVGKVPNQSEF